MLLPRFLRSILFLIVTISLVSLSCSIGTSQTTVAPTSLPATQPETVAPTSTASPPTEPPKPSGPKNTTFIFTQEYDTLNPIMSTFWPSLISQQIWNCWAWDFDEKNNPHPVLVKEIPSLENNGISNDGKTITLQLRDDIVWSDGTPITSADFLFTYQMVMDPKNTVAITSLYQKIQSLDTPNERTVVINFAEPYAAWLGTLWHGLLPAHILKPEFDKEGTLNNASWNNAPTVGCGPFAFKEWQPKQFARFTANDKYWLGRPKIDEITIRFVPDDASQITALKAGQGDLGTFFAYSSVAELQAAGIKIMSVFSGYNEGWFFYLDPARGHPALQDLRVRQAIALAFDRASLVKDLLLGQTKPAITYWDNTPYIDPSLPPLPYDPVKANQLLDEAGWVDSNGDGIRDKDGVDLFLTYGTPSKDVRQKTQELAQKQLQAVGIKLDLQNFPSQEFFSGFSGGSPAASGQLDIFEYSAKTNFPDPSTPDFLCSEIPSSENMNGSNWSAVCDPELDRLFQLQSTQVDFKTRQQTFWQISKLIYENIYFLGVWQDPDLWGVSSHLVNVKLSGATPFFNLNEWDMNP